MLMFNRDIWVDLLTRVPAKSVGRCRCVSKEWRDLLSEPSFIKAHTRQSEQLDYDALLIFNPSYGDAIRIATIPRYNNNNNNIRSYGPARVDEQKERAKHRVFTERRTLPRMLMHKEIMCTMYGHGLMLIEQLTVTEMLKKLLLVNPTTKLVRDVTCQQYVFGGYYTTYGLGYDHVADDYKILVITDLKKSVYVYLYSVRSGGWKIIQKSEYEQKIIYANKAMHMGIYASGSIHWMGDNSCILAFDLSEERFREISVPHFEYPDNRKFPNVLGELRGRLCVYNSNGRDAPVIWVMKEYGVIESWTKYVCLVERGPDDNVTPILGIAGQLLMQENYNLGFVQRISEFKLYNLDTQITTDIMIFGFDSSLSLVGSCKQTLVSPYHNHVPQRNTVAKVRENWI